MFGKNNKDKQSDSPSIVTKETIGLTLGVFSALVLIISFTGSLLFGSLGTAVTSFLFGLFGFMTYIIFLSLLYLSVTLVVGKNFIPAKGMTASGFAAVALLGLLIHAIVTSSYLPANYGEYLVSCFSAGENGAFGCSPFGIIGGLIVYPFMTIATPAGAYILLIAALGLCIYLFVNSVLIYKGIRLGLRKPKEKVREEVPQSATAQTEPITFEELENNRMPQTPTDSDISSANSPYRMPQNFGHREPAVRDPSESDYRTQILRNKTPYFSSPYTQNEKYGTFNSDFRTDFAQINHSQDSENSENNESDFDRNRNILYGAGNNPAEYRNRNLIFDTSSQYNNRPQNSTPLSVQSSAEKNINDNTDGIYGTSSYSQMYSNDIDRRNAAPVQPRKIIQEGASAQGGYSMYKKDVFDSYETANTEAQTEPIRPSYKAPEPLTPASPTPSVSAVELPREEFYQREMPRTEETVPFRNEEKSVNLRDRFHADSECRTDENTEGVSTPTAFDGDDMRVEDEKDVLDRQSLFDDDFDADDINDRKEEVSDFRRDEPRGIFSDRSREGLASAMRESRLNPSNGRENEVLPPRESIAMPPEPPVRRELGRGGTEREISVRANTEPTAAPVPPKPRIIRDYVRPSLEMFDRHEENSSIDPMEIDGNKQCIVETLAAFGIMVEVVHVTAGPTFTRYDIAIPKNITAKKISGYAEDIAMALHAIGKINIYTNFMQGTVAIEVPNRKRGIVGMRSLMQSDSYINAKSADLVFCIGKNVEGKVICDSLSKMPHMLVAGATGSGKSVFLHELIVSLIMKYSPEDVRLILVDPKQVEFAVYEKLPHLMINEIITDVNKVIVTLNWAINEMERRYTLFKQMTSSGTAVRNIDEYNAVIKKREEKLPKIVVIADEVADMMSVAKKEIEDRIARIAAKARAAGIHLVLATQRPTVDVFTGTLKSNLPSRFALHVAADVDSRTILDESGAQNLLGRGDLLYKTVSMFSSERVQCAWISSEEIQRICDFIRQNNEAYFDERISDFINNGGKSSAESNEGGECDGEAEPVYIDALRFVVQSGSASISMIQRKCSVGYNKAGKIIEWMEISGYISPFDGAKSRKVLLSADDFRAKYGEL